MVAVSLPGKYLPPVRQLDTCNICLLGRLAALLGRVNRRVSVRIHQPTRSKVTPEPRISKFGFNTIFTIFGPKHYFFFAEGSTPRKTPKLSKSDVQILFHYL
jgi:hypothetical protein